jgi:hypothetical protein
MSNSAWRVFVIVDEFEKVVDPLRIKAEGEVGGR